MQRPSNGSVPSSSADSRAPADRSAARARIAATFGADVSALITPRAAASAVERASAHEKQLLATAAAAGIRRRDPMHPVITGIAATPAIVVAAVKETIGPLMGSTDAIGDALSGIDAGLVAAEARHRERYQELNQMLRSHEQHLTALASTLAENRRLIAGMESTMNKLGLRIFVGAIMPACAALVLGLAYLVLIRSS